MSKQVFWIVLLALTGMACQSEETTSSNTKAIFDGKHNIQEGCIETFSPEADYFPQKVSFQYATGITVSYHKSYKVVELRQPWQGATSPLRYILVQCGAPVPTNEQAYGVIQVPINSVITTSTTQLPAFMQLEKIDAIKGHAGTSFITLPNFRHALETKKIREAGHNQTLNLETVVALNPDLVMRFAMSANEAIENKLEEVRIPQVINAEYMETSPLGRTEWLKFTALLFNAEAKATTVFDEIVHRYEALKPLVSAVENSPSVFTGSEFEGNWYLAGATNYMAQFLRDAGAKFTIEQNVQTLTIDFETVLTKVAKDDYWIGTTPFKTKAEALAFDERYQHIRAIQEGNYYYYDGSLFEQAVATPEAVLADLIFIFHPDKMPQHSLQFFKSMEQ